MASLVPNADDLMRLPKAPQVAKVSAPTINAKTASLNPQTDTVQGQINSIISQDNPLMQRARSRAVMEANRRGLLNTSIAAGAGETAVLDAAERIGAADAQLYGQQRMANQDFENRALIRGAELSFDADRQNAATENEFGMAGYSAAIRRGDMLSDDALQRGRMQMTSDLETGRMRTADELERGRMGLGNEFQRGNIQLQSTLEQDRMRLADQQEQGRMRLSGDLQREQLRESDALERSRLSLSNEFQRGNMQLQSQLEQTRMQAASELDRIRDERLNAQRQGDMRLDAELRNREQEAQRSFEESQRRLDRELQERITSANNAVNQSAQGRQALAGLTERYNQQIADILNNPNIPAGDKQGLLNQMRVNYEQATDMMARLYNVSLNDLFPGRSTTPAPGDARPQPVAPPPSVVSPPGTPTSPGIPPQATPLIPSVPEGDPLYGRQPWTSDA